MKKPSSKGNSLVSRSASEIPKPTPEHLAKLRAAMECPINTSDIPEIKQLGLRLKRDASGRLQKKPLGLIRKTILSALGHHQMTRYRLWQKAKAQCPTLSQSAVYEYLRGRRDIGVKYAEALIAVSGVKVSVAKPAEKPKAGKRSLLKSGVK